MNKNFCQYALRNKKTGNFISYCVDVCEDKYDRDYYSFIINSDSGEIWSVDDVKYINEILNCAEGDWPSNEDHGHDFYCPWNWRDVQKMRNDLEIVKITLNFEVV